MSLSGEGDIYYTTDGSNPKCSETKKKYSAAFEAKGLNVRAYAVAQGKLASGIAEFKI